MCFSAAASFSASAVLTVSGIYSVKSVPETVYKPLATTPLVFGLHQLTEGFLWLSLTNSTFLPWKYFLETMYLIIGQIVWPIFIPLVVYITESNGIRKKWILALLFLGLIAAVFRTITLSVYGADAEIQGCHIVYSIDRARSYTPAGVVIYLVIVIVPLLISRIKYLWIIGLLILLAFIISSIAYLEARLSVWCFFAAIISIGLIAIFRKLKKHQK